MREHGGYFSATRHPWPCFLFLLPLLLAYEGGVVWLGGTNPDALRNGADAWLRWGLEGAFGLSQLYWAPGLIAGVFLWWSWRRRWDRPNDLFGVGAGMAIESVLFALGLWALSRALVPLFGRLGVQMGGASAGPAVGQVITYVGAGIYEEVLFRLLLFSGLCMVLRLTVLPSLVSVLFAALAQAALFSAAHHLGPYGEPFNNYVFVFRTLAGLYFALLFQLRGFGVAVGAHACYDVVVGVAVGQ